MIKLSKFPFKTQKFTPNGSDNKSTWVLLQAGLIRQVMAGVYTYTTLWLKVLRKIEKIVKQEMDDYGAYETLMPALSPKELWEQTWRWDSIDVAFHVPAANNKEYSLNSTHEEVVTPLMKEFIQSYKDLPTCVYQIQNKFRNEKRAKSWILRWREFLMKDAYSFHSDDEEFVNYYEWMKKVYMNIFERIGLWEDTIIALADWWTFTDKYSHEFQVKLDIGEDTIYKDPKTWICYNQEIAPSKVWKEFENLDEEPKEMEEVFWEGLIWVDVLSKFLNIEVERTTKTILFEDENKRVIAAAVRWDYDVNEIKLKKVLWVKELKLLPEERVLEVTWSVVWYAGMIGLPDDVIKVWDDSCKNRVNFEMWANKENYHSINVNFWRDLPEPEKFYDIKDAKKWDKNPETWEVYEVFKASEIWNIFPLETKFTKAFDVTYLDENGKLQTPIMGCYGIWVSRAMWIVAEKFAKENGIAWPENIAPADYYIVVLWDNLEKAEQLAKRFEAEWKEVILDDRMGKKFGFGAKMKDAELLGIPHIIVISDKTVEKWAYELDGELVSF